MPRHALWLLALEGVPGAIYNICSGQPRRVEDVVRQLLALSSEELSLWPDPERQRPSDIPHCVREPGPAAQCDRMDLPILA